MGIILLILYWLWIAIKHVLIATGVFVVFFIPAYIFGALISKTRCVLVLPVLAIALASQYLIKHELDVLQLSFSAGGCIVSIIYIISVIRTFKVKVIRKLSFYREDGKLELALYLTLILAIIYYLNLNYFNHLFQNWEFAQFESFYIHFYIVLGIVAIYELFPSSLTLRDYKYVKDLLTKDGWLSDEILYINAMQALKDDSSSESEKEEKALHNMLRYSEICKRIVDYENGFVIRNLTQDYYFTETCCQTLHKEIYRLVNSPEGRKFDELITRISVPFSKDDLKVLLYDYMPQCRLVNKLDVAYIINTNALINSKVCDCCNTIVEQPIINEYGIFCSELCLNTEMGFMNQMNINSTIQQSTVSSVAGSNVGMISNLYNKQQYYVNKPQGTKHGFAAEVVNTDIDSAILNKAEVLGQDNIKNGADRIINGTEIQTKYYNSGKKSINAAFDKELKIFKYLKSNGEPMPIEVPRDQYDEAVNQMANKIREGKVPGYQNPSDADKLVHKGWLTYNQAKNVVKPMTIESLVYDSSQGVVIGLEAMGIGATVALAIAIWNGASFEEAVDMAIKTGGKAFTIGFLTSVGTAQMAKTEIGKNISKTITQKYGKDAMGKVLIGSNIAISFAMVTYRDFYNFFSGSISSAQLFKNVTVAGTSMATGLAVGASLGGVPGAIIGAAAGAMSGMIAKHFLDQCIDDDVIMLREIFELQFEIHSREYLLSQDDITYINDKLGQLDMNNVFRQMYSSDNRYQYVSILLKPMMIDCYKKRTDLVNFNC